MGADHSKPASEISQHVFAPDHPVRFSNGLVDSMQKNTLTDSARSQAQELAYQQRLTAELEKLRRQESDGFARFSDNLSAEPEQRSEPSLVDKLTDATSSQATLAEKQRQKDMSRESVTREIESLKTKLATRKKLEQVDVDLAKAKEAVVACLRTHDRRPLDCWKEVETFKQEVGRLEKDFVQRTIQ